LKNYDNKTTLSKKCSKCNIDTFHDQTESFESLPEVLFLIADRFTYAGTCDCPNRICTGNCDFRAFKITDPILPSEQINYNSEKLSAIYKLKGILTHHGNSVNAGHYETDISVHQGWKKSNDQSVTNISLPSKFGYIFQYQLDQLPQMEANINATNNNVLNTNSINDKGNKPTKKRVNKSKKPDPFNQNDNKEKSINRYKTKKDKQIEDMNQLEQKRAEMLNKVKEHKSFECLFENNPIITNGVEFREELNNWQMSEKCKICQESWFDQKMCPQLGKPEIKWLILILTLSVFLPYILKKIPSTGLHLMV